MINHYYWTRKQGYGVHSRGDTRFSPMFARHTDGRCLEAVYQCDIKGISPGNSDWRVGKGKPPVDTSIDTWKLYLELYRTWAYNHMDLIEELRLLCKPHDNYLCDWFSTTSLNQAHALATILYETQSGVFERLSYYDMKEGIIRKEQ